VPVLDEASYFIERYDPISRKHRSYLSRWRVALFSFMSRNSAHAIDRFKIPSVALTELGRRINCNMSDSYLSDGLLPEAMKSRNESFFRES
jgi:hypothetical protein